jgi:hypothetical protein
VVPRRRGSRIVVEVVAKGVGTVAIAALVKPLGRCDSGGLVFVGVLRREDGGGRDVECGR